MFSETQLIKWRDGRDCTYRAERGREAIRKLQEPFMFFQMPSRKKKGFFRHPSRQEKKEVRNGAQ
jgi:hypothetical protein